MNEIVRILELDIESSSLVKRAADSRKALEDVKNESKSLKSVLDEQNDTLQESAKRLHELAEQGKENTEEYAAELALHNQLNEAIADQNELYERSMSAQRRLQQEYNMSRRVLDAYNNTLEQEFHIITETDGSRNQLGQALANNRAIYSSLSTEQQQNSEVGRRLLSVIEEQTEQYNAQSNSIGVTQVNVGKYEEAITSALEKFKSGDLVGFTKDIKEMGEEFVSTTKSIYSGIIGMPVIGWIAAIAVGIGLVVNEYIKYNEELQKSNTLTNQITKLEGEMLDMATLRARVFRDKFNYEEKESLESARALVEQYKISYEEAFDIIEEGAIRGGLANQEYLESIKEYSTFFAQAGYSAQEFIALINAGADLDIFKDKLADAIKEFRLSVTEQSKPVRDALVNAFGQPFTDELLKRVSAGKITTKEALEEIAKESDKYQLSQKQQAQLTADIFKGAGEDAGGFEKIMKAVTQANINWNKPLTETQALLAKQVGLMEELEIAQHNAMKSDDFLAFKNTINDVWTGIKIVWYKSVGELNTVVKGFKLAFMNTRDVIMLIPKAVTSVFNAMKIDFQNMGRIADSFGKVLKDVFTFNFDNLGKSMEEFNNQLKNGFSTTRLAIKNVADDLLSINGRNVDIILNETKIRAEEQRKKDAEKEKPTNNFDGSQEKAAQDAKDAKEAERLRKQKEAEDKKRAEELLRIAEANAKASIKNLQTELDSFIRNNKSRIDNQTFVTQKLIDLEKNRLETIFNEQSKTLEKQKNLELSNTKLTEDEKKEIRVRYADQESQFLLEKNEQLKEINDRYKEQLKQTEDFRKLEQHQKDLNDLKTQQASEFEIKLAQLDFEYENNQERKTIQKEIDQIDKQTQDEETIQRKTDLEMALSNIEFEHSETRKQIKIEEQQSKLSIAAGVAGAIADIAGKETVLGKTAAVAQATINTYQGATLALSSYPGPIGIAMAAATVLSGLMSVGKIVGVNTGTSAQGFSQLAGLAKNYQSSFGSKKKAEKGILLKGNSHAQGGINLYDDNGNHVVEAEGDELLAVINKRSTGLLSRLSNINVLGGGIPLTHQVTHAASGGLISGKTQVDNTVIVDVSEEVGKMVGSAAYDGIRQGMRDLSDERQVSLDAQY